MARPQIKIDQTQFEQLCAMQCTLNEIASWFHCSEDTIERWCRRTYTDEAGKAMGFADTYKVYSAAGKISLRRIQFKQAEKSYAMAIWLGKQWLGQRDVVETIDATEESTISKIAKAILEEKENQNDD